MAPRRNNNGHSGQQTALDVHNLLAGLESVANDSSSIDHINHNHTNGNTSLTTTTSPTAASNNSTTVAVCENVNFTRCCVPSGDCFKSTSIDFGLISMNDLSECIRVICNNENCSAGQFMHRECFEAWEQGVLTYLKSIGRARSWSDRQRQQNLWTKKGYDLVFKACGCKCGRGHLKKDLDWVAPMLNNIFGGRIDDEANKKKKKRHRNNQKPTLAVTTTNPSVYHPNTQIVSAHNGVNTVVSTIMAPIELRTRTGSLSSSNGSSSPPVSASSEHSISPVHSNSGAAHKEKSKIEAYSERVRTTSGCNGIFSRRLDFSTFNMLPRTRLNSYQIKMEDEGNHGNDETRLFILSSLAQHQKSRVSCILCEEPMLVFDRYPLVDGTFFLSPKQHAKGCIEVKYDNHTQYLTAVCMGCLEGVSQDRIIRCRFCAQKWDGSSLVLGTMYAYDIFAAMPCCTERLKCNNCYKLLIHPNQRLNFFSDYSHVVSCTTCNTHDTHFIKPLPYCYSKHPLQNFDVRQQQQHQLIVSTGSSLVISTPQQQKQQITSSSTTSSSPTISSASSSSSGTVPTDAFVNTLIQELKTIKLGNSMITNNIDGVMPFMGDSSINNNNKNGGKNNCNINNNNNNPNTSWTKLPLWDASSHSPTPSIKTQYHSASSHSNSKESLWHSTQSSPNSNLREQQQTSPQSNIWESPKSSIMSNNNNNMNCVNNNTSTPIKDNSYGSIWQSPQSIESPVNRLANLWEISNSNNNNNLCNSNNNKVDNQGVRLIRPHDISGGGNNNGNNGGNNGEIWCNNNNSNGLNNVSVIKTKEPVGSLWANPTPNYNKINSIMSKTGNHHIHHNHHQTTKRSSSPLATPLNGGVINSGSSLLSGASTNNFSTNTTASSSCLQLFSDEFLNYLTMIN